MTDIVHSGTSTDDGGLRERSEATASTARESASSVAQTAQSQLGEVTTEARDQARAVAEDAKHQARRLVHESRQQLSSQAQEQSARLAGGVRDVSQQLQQMARGGGAPQGLLADLTTQAADIATQVADRLEQRQPEELLDDLRRFARRRPGLFLLGAMGAGLAVGRLVKAVDPQGVVDAAKSAATGDAVEAQRPELAGRPSELTAAPSSQPRPGGVPSGPPSVVQL